MGNSISARWRHFTALWKERVWAKWIGLPYSFACLYVFVRDDFWQPKKPEQWWIINMIPSLSLGWWIAGALAIICLWIFEASFRLTRRFKEDAETNLREAAIRLPRPLAYERITLQTGANGQDAVINGFEVIVHNNSQETLLWSIKRLLLFLDGEELAEGSWRNREISGPGCEIL